MIYEHRMPFDVSRAYDMAGGMERPQIWTAERDQRSTADHVKDHDSQGDLAGEPRAPFAVAKSMTLKDVPDG